MVVADTTKEKRGLAISIEYYTKPLVGCSIKISDPLEQFVLEQVPELHLPALLTFD